MAQQSTHVMNKRTGVVFVATDKLRGMDDMEACNSDGTPFLAFVEEEGAVPEAFVEGAVTTDPVLNGETTTIPGEPAPEPVGE